MISFRQWKRKEKWWCLVEKKTLIHLLSTKLINLVVSKIKMHFSYLDSTYGIEWKIKKSSWNNTEESKLKCESVPCYANNDSVQSWTSGANNFYESITKARCLGWILKSMSFGWLSFFLSSFFLHFRVLVYSIVEFISFPLNFSFHIPGTNVDIEDLKPKDIIRKRNCFSICCKPHWIYLSALPFILHHWVHICLGHFLIV